MTLAYILFWTLVVLVVVQGWLVFGFVWRLLSFRGELLGDEDCPQAAVILCLRGGDPFLEKCIDGLLTQDYPNYHIHIVVDHQDDPALRILEPVLDENNNKKVHIQFLEDRRATCSLKCSSVVQAVGSLDDSVEFIAQLDADTIPHSSWLRELATALSDERVGAATGNRWYMPDTPSLASLVRYAWNAAAVVQMYWYRIAWGGTLAVKTSVFRETDLLDKWSNAFCEDTMLFTELKGAGLRLAFVPSLMMVNREACDLAGYYRWVRRQLLTARLYHPAWLAVAGHGVLTTVMPLLAVGVAIFAWPLQNQTAALVAVGGLLFYQVAITLALLPMEFAVRRIASARGEPTQWLGVRRVWKACLAVLVTQVIYAVALYSATRIRRVDWRGVWYQIDGPRSIRLVEYEPFETSQTESAASL